MHVTLVQIRVKPEHRDAFIKACRLNHEQSVQEPGNRRFDVLQSTEDENSFALYEAYTSAEDAAAHKQTPHYQQWRETVANWMTEPRVGVPFVGLYPES